ncbi:hypothetical protein IscW_ISCW012797 [Ixodes scapularis]|uniref:Uncharacterized protein n=1 Tax=Ixodes scapularis TaxID=6945 RepID=B7QCP7_IXOSC|nr:hypothetical protein IscW_ISCW012797 [Ixodes scapularis]|eukprot:XP_002413311.1 hypothetical protein IscW_ISCW012797 [Ixodes scapularis]
MGAGPRGGPEPGCKAARRWRGGPNPDPSGARPFSKERGRLSRFRLRSAPAVGRANSSAQQCELSDQVSPSARSALGLALVPQHWLAFRPPPPRHHLALAAAYLPLFFAGLLGNGAIIFLFLT